MTVRRRLRLLSILFALFSVVAMGAMIVCLATVNRVQNFTLPNGLPAYGPTLTTVIAFFVLVLIGLAAVATGI